MPRRIEAQPFFRPDSESLRYLPECPRVLEGALLWVSIQYAAGQPLGGLNILDLATLRNVHHPLPGRPGFFAPTARPGEIVIGLERRLVLYDLAGARITETLGHIPEDDRVIINDGIAIPGGLIFGTKHLHFKLPVAALYHYDNATREIRELRGGQVCSNGKCFHDGCLIDIDTQPKTITEYRYDGALHPVRLITPPVACPLSPMAYAPPAAAPPFSSPITIPTPCPMASPRKSASPMARSSPSGSCPALPASPVPEISGDFVYFTTAVEGMPAPTANAGTLFRAPLR